MLGFLSKDCLHPWRQLCFCLAMFGTCLAPAPVLSPLSTSVLLPLTASAPGALLLSACVSPDAGLMLGRAQDPSLALSPTGGGTSLRFSK